MPAASPSTQPVTQARTCLMDSDINSNQTFICENGPNKGVTYYLVAANVTIGKKQLHQGEWPQGYTLPQSCIAAGIGQLQGSLVDRAIRQSQRCTDTSASVYEAWCGDYCNRSLKGQMASLFPGTLGNEFCSIAKGDDYMGCFNEAFLFKLKDPPFNPDANNTFDLYIRSDRKISDIKCRNVETEIRRIAQDNNIAIPQTLQNAFECFNELFVDLTCKPQ